VDSNNAEPSESVRLTARCLPMTAVSACIIQLKMSELARNDRISPFIVYEVCAAAVLGVAQAMTHQEG
jgi:hypothetical protein